MDSHPFFPSHAASGRCVLSAAAACAPAGVVCAFAERRRSCAGAVLVAPPPRPRAVSDPLVCETASAVHAWGLKQIWGLGRGESHQLRAVRGGAADALHCAWNTRKDMVH